MSNLFNPPKYIRGYVDRSLNDKNLMNWFSREAKLQKWKEQDVELVMGRCNENTDHPNHVVHILLNHVN